MTRGCYKKTKKKTKTNTVLSVSLDLFSCVDCHSSKIVHLVSSRDYVTLNNNEYKYIYI